MTDFAAYRRKMIESQLRPNQVLDTAVLAAFGEVPRERFVPADLASCAYIDDSVPLGAGRYLSEPRAAARLVQAVAPSVTSTVLIVGAGTGYLAAVVSRLAGNVIALECDVELAARARAILADLGIGNVTVVTGDFRAGWPQNAPYDVILCDGGVAEVPQPLRDQLTEGGRLGAVITRNDGTVGHGVLMLKVRGTVSRRTLFDAVTPLLPGLGPQPAFVF
ncbi:MAG TPA: protein-L-isoaspartate O-methyltransferase [Alphaproteobacteria bacterium]|jgi:protein-L-isoaspartate(D-aspartate) O-methyltransferase|nr:protein-L-isoaspartate O-methyltransferase [Alphaproteobacteria bacterium]